MSYEPTRSTKEAMQLLQATRSVLIQLARSVAYTQCLDTGHTHTRKVIAEMEERGMLDPAVKTDHWLGKVFYDGGDFEKTGEQYSYTDTSRRAGRKRRNVHERTINVWRLRKRETDDN